MRALTGRSVYSLDPVQATYREHNCHTQKTSSYQKDKDFNESPDRAIRVQL